MKIYELGTPSHYDDDSSDCDCTIWIACNHPIKLISEDKNIYLKEIPEYDETTPGVDLIIT
jgi:hypothetical protein